MENVTDFPATNGQAEFDEGNRLLNGNGVAQDIVGAVSYFRRSAEKGHPDGIRLLGMSYLCGRGVQRNSNKAMALLLEAGCLDDRIAVEVFGSPFSDLAEAFTSMAKLNNWIKFAANHGCPQNMMILGEAYEKGHSMTKNKTKSYVCFSAAFWFGISKALFDRERVSRTMTKAQITEAQNKVIGMTAGNGPLDF